MTLFPTSSLRALARYIEAEDFETSNTIEAYDRALEMYRTSLDLKYCLARVEVERTVQQLLRPADFSKDSHEKAIRRLNQAAFDYEEATAADPSVAAAFSDAQGKSRNNYYEYINRHILARYELLASRALKLQILLFQRKASLGQDQLINTLVSCALNDYGNACLNYHLRFEVGIGKDPTLKMAREHFTKSCEIAWRGSRILRGGYKEQRGNTSRKAAKTRLHPETAPRNRGSPKIYRRRDGPVLRVNTKTCE